MVNQDKNDQQSLGFFFLIIFFILIISGIIAKRVYDYPDHMVFYHLPAAVFLVMAWSKLSVKIRRRYQNDIQTLFKSKGL